MLFSFSSELLIAGDMIELAEVVEMATTFLVEQLDPSNAIGIYRYVIYFSKLLTHFFFITINFSHIASE